MKRRMGTAHTITMSGTTQSTNAFGSQTYRVRVATNTQPAYIVIGDSPSATANDSVMPAGWVEEFDVTPGQKLAALQGGTAGVITVTELT